MDGSGSERFDTVVIGGGQAGLAAGYFLAKAGRQFVILDAHERVGDAWRKRWDSLRLFTPARYDGLTGMRFPGPRSAPAPTKDEMADYLEAYASRFDLPIRTGVRVDGLSKDGDRYVVTAGGRRFEADNVVVASGAHHEPRIPAFARELDPAIVQVHSGEYLNPSQLRDGGVLVVGAGNSGADISIEVVRTHPTWLSGRSTGHIPFHIDTLAARFVLIRIVRFVGHHVLTLRTPLGRKVRRKFQSQGGPLVRVKPKEILAAGVERTPKTVGAKDGRPVLEDGRMLDVTNVIWCTGYGQNLSWIDLPIFAEDGEPLHDRGVVPSSPGLYLVGLTFQFAATSETIPGVGRDAEYVVKHLLSQDDRRRRSTVPVAA
jgi:putative flavoprotein involved in K+ transport